MVPFIGAGISLISGAVSNLFTGEGRERRQTRRLERRQRRAERQAARVGVKLPGKVPLEVLKEARKPRIDDIKAPRVRRPAGQWLEENWMIVAGGGVALVAILFLAFRKKKR